MPRNDHQEAIDRLKAISPEERDRISAENIRQAEAEHAVFLDAFHSGRCYLCKKPLLTFGSSTPCLHWLLKPKGFRKSDLPAVVTKFGFFRMQTYLRWVANTDGFARHINDLADEGTGKLIELTIRYKRLEWSFSAARSDYLGHQGASAGSDGHFHFQMRIDRQQFINFNDFHLPFSDADHFGIEAGQQLPDIVKHKFPGGEGMAEVLNDQTVEVLVKHGRAASNEKDAPLKLDTLVMADEGQTIKGEDLYRIIQEARRTGATVSSLMHKLPNVKTQVYVSPGDGVVEQAPRSSRNKKR